MDQCDMDRTRMELRNTHLLYISGISGMLKDLECQFGEEVSSAAAQSYCNRAVKQLLKGADPDGDRSIQSFIRFLWEPLRAFGFQFSTHESSEGLQVICTSCPWATLFSMIGAEKWGFTLQCAADCQLVEEFNPKIGFRRTKTLMEGHDHCDHFYFMKAGAPE